MWHYSGSEYQTNPTPFICAGDIARLEMDLDLLKGCHEMLSIWDEDIAEVCLFFLTTLKAYLCVPAVLGFGGNCQPC